MVTREQQLHRKPIAGCNSLNQNFVRCCLVLSQRSAHKLRRRSTRFTANTKVSLRPMAAVDQNIAANQQFSDPHPSSGVPFTPRGSAVPRTDSPWNGASGLLPFIGVSRMIAFGTWRNAGHMTLGDGTCGRRPGQARCLRFRCVD